MYFKPVKSWGPKAGEPGALKSKGKRKWKPQLKKREKGHPSLAFGSILHLADWMMLIHTGEGRLLYSAN